MAHFHVQRVRLAGRLALRALPLREFRRTGAKVGQARSFAFALAGRMIAARAHTCRHVWPISALRRTRLFLRGARGRERENRRYVFFTGCSRASIRSRELALQPVRAAPAQIQLIAERVLKRLYQILPRFLSFSIVSGSLKMITNRRKHFFKDRHVFNGIRHDRLF